ncbi:hypothetical protein EXS57_00955 [Candidatus Kaiserbacteria bacterium]|nr:hypothetical protein [Candidatus Kaiserbacteria bacterium]
MRILIIDDKIEEMKRAQTAVEASGHSAVPCLGPWAMTLDEDTLPDRAKSCVASAKLPILSVWSALDQLLVDRERGESVGVLTDLMFPLTMSSGVQPSGLAVAAHAVANRIPVVICTDADGNHHAGPCGMVRDGYVGRVSGKSAFGFNSSKDWVAAVSELERRSTSQG